MLHYRGRGRYRVVPLAMEFVWADIQCGHFGVCDFDTGWVSAVVDLGFDVESGARCGGGDQLHDGLVAHQGLAAPILGDERE